MQSQLITRGKAPDDDMNPPQHQQQQQQQPDSSDIDSIRLREYELNKMKYYFAIAEFKDIDTAEKVWVALDGVELEHSSMVLDLRFVPSHMRYIASSSKR